MIVSKSFVLVSRVLAVCHAALMCFIVLYFGLLALTLYAMGTASDNLNNVLYHSVLVGTNPNFEPVRWFPNSTAFSADVVLYYVIVLYGATLIAVASAYGYVSLTHG
jgi:hypothetical protein